MVPFSREWRGIVLAPMARERLRLWIKIQRVTGRDVRLAEPRRRRAAVLERGHVGTWGRADGHHIDSAVQTSRRRLGMGGRDGRSGRSPASRCSSTDPSNALARAEGLRHARHRRERRARGAQRSHPGGRPLSLTKNGFASVPTSATLALRWFATSASTRRRAVRSRRVSPGRFVRRQFVGRGCVWLRRGPATPPNLPRGIDRVNTSNF